MPKIRAFKKDFILNFIDWSLILKSIYVGNMPYSATKEQIAELFGKFGEVSSIKIILDRETKRPKGFCFVEMEDAEAIKAIEVLNDEEFLGRKLKVNEAKSKA